MKKLKIMLAIGSSEIGGGQKVFLSLIKELLRKEYSVVVVMPKGPLVEQVRTCNVFVHIVELNSMSSLWSIARIIKKERCDIINTYLTKCSLLFAFVNVVFRRPLCCTLLNAITHEKLSLIQKRIYPFVYYFLQKLSSGIIVNSEQNRKHFVDVAGMNEKDVKVIYSGIDVDEFTKFQQGRTRSSKFVIGTVGRLSPEKGHPYLIKALSYLKKINFECFIVGDGPLRSELETLVASENIVSRVKFYGFQKNVAQIMSQMDVVVMPSLNETFGITILEAFSLKILVIATEVGGIPELVKHKITGLLCPSKNSLALAEAIEFAYNSRSDIDLITENAYRFLNTHFTSEAMINNTLAYYDTISTQTA